MNCISASSFAKDGGIFAFGLLVDFLPLLNFWDLVVVGEPGGFPLDLDFLDRRIENERKRLMGPGFFAGDIDDVGLLT